MLPCVEEKLLERLNGQAAHRGLGPRRKLLQAYPQGPRKDEVDNDVVAFVRLHGSVGSD